MQGTDIEHNAQSLKQIRKGWGLRPSLSEVSTNQSEKHVNARRNCTCLLFCRKSHVIIEIVRGKDQEFLTRRYHRLNEARKNEWTDRTAPKRNLKANN